MIQAIKCWQVFFLFDGLNRNASEIVQSVPCHFYLIFLQVQSCFFCADLISIAVAIALFPTPKELDYENSKKKIVVNCHSCVLCMSE